MPLGKQERKQARERIEQFHQDKLAELQRYVYEKSDQFYQGKINTFDLDYIIHIYHKQSQELFTFINYYYPSNDRLEILLKLIQDEEKGKWHWESKI